jgi:hypothetical protein
MAVVRVLCVVSCSSHASPLLPAAASTPSLPALPRSYCTIDASELLSKCHPLGLFDAMGTLTVGTSPAELYESVLVDTPLGPYFMKCLSQVRSALLLYLALGCHR